MTFKKNIIGYDLIGLTDEEAQSLLRMIESAALPERRVFKRVKDQIKDLSRR